MKIGSCQHHKIEDTKYILSSKLWWNILLGLRIYEKYSQTTLWNLPTNCLHLQQ